MSGASGANLGKVKGAVGESTFFQHQPLPKESAKAFIMAEKLVFHNVAYLWVFLYHCDY